MAVCSEIHTKHINTLCGQNAGSLMLNLVVQPLILKFNFSESLHKSLSYTFNSFEDYLFFTPKGLFAAVFSGRAQSFSSCHSHNCSFCRDLFDTENYFEVSHGHPPLWTVVPCSRENLNFTFTFTQVPSSSTPYSLNCTNRLNLTHIISALASDI